MSALIVHPNSKAMEILLYELSQKRGWELRLLGTGASSVAWLAENAGEQWIIRATPSESQKPSTYPQEFAVLQRLYQAGFAVPEPLFLNAESPLASVAFSWMISRKAKGEAIKKENPTKEMMEDLARLLAFLHKMPADGWGWLTLKEGRFWGDSPTPLDGARARWKAYPLWPLDETKLEAHPLSYTAQFFLPVLRRLMPELLRAASLGARALCHSDLHREHLWVQDGKLSAVIDFGDACLLPPAWEFAILARYYGWPVVNKMLPIYDAQNCEALLRQALALGVIVGMYKFNRQYRSQASVLLRAQELFFLQTSLEHWQGRPIA